MREVLEEGFIDIHNHIIYGVDDGSKTREMSLEMLEFAYAQGIRGMILTPHYHPEKTRADEATIVERFEDLKAEMAKRHPDFSMYRGYELYCAMDILEELEDYEWDNLELQRSKGRREPMMADSRFVLMEYSPSTPYDFIRKSINRVLQAGWTPIVAHVERYNSMVESVDNVEELIEMGACIQVNVSSVMGEIGGNIKKYVKQLMKRDLVDFVATDAHRSDHRKPEMKDCARYISKKFGVDYARKLFIDNPSIIVQ